MNQGSLFCSFFYLGVLPSNVLGLLLCLWSGVTLEDVSGDHLCTGNWIVISCIQGKCFTRCPISLACDPCSWWLNAFRKTNKSKAWIAWCTVTVMLIRGMWRNQVKLFVIYKTTNWSRKKGCEGKGIWPRKMNRNKENLYENMGCSNFGTIIFVNHNVFVN